MATRYLPLACFGKLPFWREYLEVGTSHATARALKHWLHEGKEQLGLDSGEQKVSDVAIQAQLRILLGVPGSRELLVGVLRPSNDAGGRHYPFAVFTHFARKLYRKHYELLPLALAPAWEALDDAWESLAAAPSRTAFDESLNSLEVPQPVGPAEARGDYQGRQREQAQSLFESQNGASPECLTRNMPGVLDRLRKAGGTGVSLQLPVARDLDEACFNVSLWVDLLNRQLRLRRFEPSVFLDEKGGAENRQVVLKYGALQPSDYLEIVGAAGETNLLRPAHPAGTDPVQGPSDSTGVSYGELLGTRF